MMRTARNSAAAAAFAFLSSTTPSFAVPLTAEEILEQFNLVVFGDLSSVSDVEGRTYIGGDLSGTSTTYFAKGNEAPASDLAALIVGGDVGGGPHQVEDGGSATIGGDLNAQLNLNGIGGVRYVAGDVNVAQNGDPASTVQGPVEIPDFETPLRQLSADLTGLPANATASIDGTKGVFAGTPDANGALVFWIDGVDVFGTVTDLEFLVDGAGTVIINVAGGIIDIAANFLNGIGETIAASLLWNFYEATDIGVGTDFFGAVLAPDATLTNTSFMRGSVAANEVVQLGEMQLAPFAGTIPSTDVPEPHSALLLLPGLFGLIALARAFRRQTAVA